VTVQYESGTIADLPKSQAHPYDPSHALDLDDISRYGRQPCFYAAPSHSVYMIEYLEYSGTIADLPESEAHPYDPFHALALDDISRYRRAAAICAPILYAERRQRCALLAAIDTRALTAVAHRDTYWPHPTQRAQSVRMLCMINEPTLFPLIPPGSAPFTRGRCCTCSNVGSRRIRSTRSAGTCSSRSTPTRSVIMLLAANNTQILYTAPSYLVCIISGCRFATDKIYSFCGDVLISLNPYKVSHNALYR
jgi:hypothetical protein